MADGIDHLGLAAPQSSLDFAGLGALRGKAQQKSDKALRETATQFEAMFIQEMLKNMRASIEKSELSGSDAEDQFTQMYDRELSVQLARRNTMGVADMIVSAVERNSGSQSADFKAKAEAMPLHPPAQPVGLSAGAPAMKLVRPEKFNLERRATAPAPGADE